MDTKTTRLVNEELRRIAAKWINGRTEAARLQGSSLVVAGNSAPQRALLNLALECSSDLAALFGPLPDDYMVAVSEMFNSWKNPNGPRK